MKKIMLILLIACIVCSGCGEKESDKYDSMIENQNNNEQQGTKENSEETKTNGDEKTIDDLENYLIEKNLLTGDRTKMDASLIGGIEGFKYSDSNTEIYDYDINSEEYKKLSQGDEVEIKGLENYSVKAVSINGKFVLMGEPSEKIIDAFNSFE